MRVVSEIKALERLAEIRDEFASEIRMNFERRAKSCATCETPGACCLDAHFVNVRISRLEAKAIRNALAELPNELREKVEMRIDETISTYKLDEVLDTSTATYACPLFEKNTGCLVHNTAKPMPCIAHACYESKSDLPPEAMLENAELSIQKLNIQTYGNVGTFLPIPLAISDPER